MRLIEYQTQEKQKILLTVSFPTVNVTSVDQHNPYVATLACDSFAVLPLALSRSTGFAFRQASDVRERAVLGTAVCGDFVQLATKSTRKNKQLNQA